MEPFKPADKEQVEARTIYVENLPSDADHESLKKVVTFCFSQIFVFVHFLCIIIVCIHT